MNLMIWGCEDSNKHPEYMKPWGCEDARILKSTRSQGYEDVRMRGYKQASTHEHKDIKMRGCEDINKSNISNT